MGKEGSSTGKRLRRVTGPGTVIVRVPNTHVPSALGLPRQGRSLRFLPGEVAVVRQNGRVAVLRFW